LPFGFDLIPRVVTGLERERASIISRTHLPFFLPYGLTSCLNLEFTTSAALLNLSEVSPPAALFKLELHPPVSSLESKFYSTGIVPS
jgi:hypothetical protein